MAKQAGMFDPPGVGLSVARLQVVTIEEALRRGVDAARLPLRSGDTFKKAAKPAGDLFG